MKTSGLGIAANCKSFRSTLWLGLMLCVGLLGHGAALAAPAYPAVRLMIVVPESLYGRQAAEPAAETELIRIFAEAKYRVIDQQQYAAKRYTPDLDRVLLNPTSSEARALLGSTGADILIVGKATCNWNPAQGGSVAKARAELSLRAIYVSNGEIITSAQETASGADGSDMVAGKIALRRVGAVCAGELMKRIGEAVGGPTSTKSTSTSSAPHKTRIGVMKFEDCSGTGATYQLTTQMPHLVSKALQDLDKFEMVELVDINSIKQTNADVLGGEYKSNAGRDAELGKLAPPDYVVKGRISEFSAKVQSVDDDGIVGALAGKFLRRVAGRSAQTEEATVRLQIEIVELSTGVVVASGEASGHDLKPVLGGLGGTLLNYVSNNKSAIGQATRTAVSATVAIVSGKVPSLVGGNLVKCPKCPRMVPAGASFCDDCGAALVAKPSTCPKCGDPVAADAKHCMGCGAKLEPR